MYTCIAYFSTDCGFNQVYLDLLKDELQLLKDAEKMSYAVYELVDLVLDKFPPKVTAKKFKDFDKTDLDHCREMEEWDRMSSGKNC